MIKKLLLILINIAIAILPTQLFSAQASLFINNDGQYQLVDLSSLSVKKAGNLSKVHSIGTIDGQVSVDEKSMKLYIVDRSGDVETVLIYDLLTFNYIKPFGMSAPYKDDENALQVFVNPALNQMYMKHIFSPEWIEASELNEFTQIVSIYNSTDYKLVRKVEGLSLSTRISVSTDGFRIYSYGRTNDRENLSIFDLPSFSVSNTVNIIEKLTAGVYGWGVVDYLSGEVLIIENHKQKFSDPGNYTIFVYDIDKNMQSSRISTGLMGEATLIPGMSMTALSETIRVPHISGFTRKKRLAKLHFYDLAESKEVKLLDFGDGIRGRIYAVTPDGKYLFYSLPDKTAVIDLSTYTVIKELPIGAQYDHVLFYNEPDEAPAQ